jgi:hypothetical protein
MNQTSELTGSHLRTYDTIFRHPAAHNLEWRHVRALFDHIADVTEQPNGNLRVTRNGHSMVLHTPQTKDVADIEELMSLRHFLQQSEKAAVGSADKDAHWLVVINHHEARVFHSEMPGTVAVRIQPPEAAGASRHEPGNKDFVRGREKPDANAYFEPVTAALRGAGDILLFGAGKGTGSEMEQLVAWLKRHHPEVAARVVGTQVIDEHHLTDAQLMMMAREQIAGCQSRSSPAWPVEPLRA